MKTLLIGHRGVGKSSFLKRIGAYHKNSVTTLDLDAMIEAGERASVADIFSQKGEAEFRKLEHRYLRRALTQKGDSFIAVGAGFEFDALDRALIDFASGEIEIWWLKRVTDSMGRIFLDRPRLNDQTSAFAEYHERFAKREALYRHIATSVLVIDEGYESANEPERKWVCNEISNLGFDLTVTADAFRNSFQDWSMKRRGWGVRFFELRDDLLSLSQLKIALKTLSPEHVLFSFRSLDALAHSKQLIENHTCAFDWAGELGTFYDSGRSPGFFSRHHREDQALQDCLKSAESFQNTSPSTVLKIAVPIENFTELAEGHEWMMQDPQRRVFLPCSSSGRWSWYRLWQRRQLRLNFMREDGGSSADQPTVLQALRAQQTPGAGGFAAILGQPVTHSRTPAEQTDFFGKRGWPVYQIDVSENEWTSALRFLRKVGLKAAAVTSPLKLKAFESSDEKTALADNLKSVNTLWFGKTVRGHNTDKKGFEVLLSQAQAAESVGVWGGGGTLSLVRAVLPQVIAYAARTGQPRDAHSSAKPPSILIWAVSRARFTGVWPTFQPQLIIDLNYGDDSPARELALRTGARYISGLAMFEAQAQAQREFWTACEESEHVSQ